MKKTGLLFLFFIALITKAQHNAMDVTYVHQFKFNKTLDEYEKEYFSLLINPEKNTSLYTSLTKKISDSIYQVVNTITNHGYDLNKIPESKFNFQVYKETNSGFLLLVEKIKGERFGYLYKGINHWKLKEETAEILGYKCKSAETNFGGRTWKAFYTEQIPVQNGPYKFDGLPGLILEIFSLDGEHSIKIAGLKKNNIPISKPKYISLKDRNKLIIFKQEYIKDPSSKERIEDSRHSFKEMIVNGEKVSLSRSYDILNEEAWSFAKKYNNPIETDDIWIR